MTPAEAVAQLNAQRRADSLATAAANADQIQKESEAPWYQKVGRVAKDTALGLNATVADIGLLATNIERYSPSGLIRRGVASALNIDNPMDRVQDELRTFTKAMNDSKSATQNDARLVLQNELSQASGFNKVGAVAMNPGAALGYGVESLPYMLPGLGLARAGGSVAALGGLNATINGGLTFEQTYQGALAAGATEDEARKAAFISVPSAAATGYLAGRLTAPLNKFAVGRGPSVGLPSAFLLEGGEEVIESVGNKFGENLGYRNTIAPNQSLTTGMADDAAMGFVVGGLTGTGMHLGGTMVQRGQLANGQPIVEAPAMFEQPLVRAPVATPYAEPIQAPTAAAQQYAMQPGVQLNIDGQPEMAVRFEQPETPSLGGVINYENANQPDMFGAPSANEQNGLDRIPPWEGENQFAAERALGVQNAEPVLEPAHIVALRAAAIDSGTRAFNRDDKPVGGRGRGSLYAIANSPDVPAAILENFNPTAANATLLDTWHQKMTGMGVEEAQLRATQGAQQDIFGDVAVNQYAPEVQEVEPVVRAPKEQQRLFTRTGDPKFYARGDRRVAGSKQKAEPVAQVVSEIQATLTPDNASNATYVSDATLAQPEVLSAVESAQAAGATVLEVNDGTDSGLLVADNEQSADEYARIVDEAGVAAAHQLFMASSESQAPAQSITTAPTPVQTPVPVAQARPTPKPVAPAAGMAAAAQAITQAQEVANATPLSAGELIKVKGWQKRIDAKQTQLEALTVATATLQAQADALDTAGKSASDSAKVARLESRIERQEREIAALSTDISELQGRIAEVRDARANAGDGRGKHSKVKSGNAAYKGRAWSDLLADNNADGDTYAEDVSSVTEGAQLRNDAWENLPTTDRAGYPSAATPLEADPRTEQIAMLADVENRAAVGEAWGFEFTPAIASALEASLNGEATPEQTKLIRSKVTDPDLRAEDNLAHPAEVSKLVARMNEASGYDSLATEGNTSGDESTARKSLGQLGTALEAAGMLEFVDTLGGAQGRFTDGMVQVALDALGTPEQTRATVWHEVLHSAIAGGRTPAAIRTKLFSGAQELIADQNAPRWVRDTLTDMRGRFKRAGQPMPTGDVLTHEFMSYTLENYEAQNRTLVGKLGKLVQDFVATVRVQMSLHAKFLGVQLKPDAATLKAVAKLVVGQAPSQATTALASEPRVRTDATSVKARTTEWVKLLSQADRGNADGMFQNPIAPVSQKSLQEVAATVSRGRVRVSSEPIVNDDGSREYFIYMADGKPGVMVEQTNGDIYIDASQLKSTTSKGSLLYAIVGNYAFNNDKVFIGDPNGLSTKAMFRRTENMASLALKFGTAKFMKPHPRQMGQGIGMADEAAAEALAAPLRWSDDDATNVRSLLEASYANTLALAPEIENVRYDFGNKQFVGGDGKVFTDKRFKELANQSAADLQLRGLGAIVSSGTTAEGTEYARGLVGSATLKTAALYKSLGLAGSSEATGRPVLDQVSRQLRRDGLDPALSGIRYSLPADETEAQLNSLPGFNNNTVVNVDPADRAKARPAFLGGLTMHQISDIYGDTLIGLRAKVDVVRRRGASFVNHYERVQALSALTDKLSATERTSMESLQQDAKRAGFDPALFDAADPKTHPRSPDQVLLQKSYDALEAETKSVYLDQRDFYENVWVDLYTAMRSTIEFSRASSATKIEQLKKLAETFEARKAPYFPSMRYGEFVVVERDSGGTVTGYHQRETANARDALAQELIAKGARVEVTKRDKVHESVPLNSLLGTSEELAHAMRAYAASNGLSRTESAAANNVLHELLLDRLPETSAANNLRRYKGTAGEDANSVRALAAYATRMGALLANTKMRSADSAATSDVRNNARGKPEQSVVHWVANSQRNALAFNTASEMHEWLSENISTLPRVVSGTYNVADFEVTSVPYGTAASVVADIAASDPSLATSIDTALKAVAPLAAPLQNRDALVNLRNELDLRENMLDTGELTTAIRALTGLTYARYLFFSLRQMAGNFAQVAGVTYTELGGKYGWSTAGAAMAGGMTRFGKVWATGLGSITTSKSFNPQTAPGLTQSERAVLQMMMDYKLLDFTLSRDIAQAASGDSAVAQKAFAIGGYLNHQSEMLIRGSTALATFELAQKRGATQAQALIETRRVVESTLGDYAEVNKARYMRSGILRLPAQFKNYQQQMLVRNVQLAAKAFKGDAVAKRQFAGMLAITTLIGGARGAPFMGLIVALATALRGFFDDDDDMINANTDPVGLVEDVLVDIFGAEVGRMMTHGMLQEMLGISIQSSIGQADLVPGFTMREGYTAQGTKSEFGDSLQALLGPAGGMMKDLANSAEYTGAAIEAARLGDSRTAWRNVAKAVEGVAPKAVSDVVKATRFANDGSTNRAGDYNASPEKVKELGTLIRTATGLTPEWLDELRREQVSGNNYANRLQGERSGLMDNLTRMYNNGEDTTAAQNAIIRWNGRVPDDMRITEKKMLESLKSGARDAIIAEQTEYRALNKSQADTLVDGGQLGVAGGMTTRPKPPKAVRPPRPTRPGKALKFEAQPEYFYTGDE